VVQIDFQEEASIIGGSIGNEAVAISAARGRSERVMPSCVDRGPDPFPGGVLRGVDLFLRCSAGNEDIAILRSKEAIAECR